MYPFLKGNVSIHLTPSHSLIYDQNSLYDAEYLNKTASEILELCGGLYTTTDIAKIMSERYNEEFFAAQEFVNEFLEEAHKKGYIYFLPKAQKVKCEISGTYKVITPLSISMEITKKCPMSCRHCYVESSRDNNVFLDFEEIMLILDEARDLGIPNMFLTGGEIFEHPRLLEIIDYIYNNFHSLTLATSGYYIDEEKINIL